MRAYLFGGVLIPLACVVPLRAQAPTDAAAFLVRLGLDTTSVERFVHTGNRIEGDVVTRAPRTTLRHYVADLGPDHVMTRLDVVTLRPDAPAGTPPVQRLVASFARDTAAIEVRRGDSVQTRRVAIGDAIPLFAFAWATVEQLTMRFRRLQRESTEVRVYFVGGSLPVSAVPMRRIGRDSLSIGLPTGTVHVRTDDRGRILGLVGAPGATQQIALARLPSADVPAFAAGFAARDAQGRGLGPLSPRDTARATVAGATLWVDYSRPSKRGRLIFGGVVPWDTIWRTGANAATQFRTDRDLEMGGVRVPAGFYTLWTIPSPSGWKLLINSETGQWGTDHHPERDVFRLDMRVSSLAQPVERFTIAVAAEGQGGVLKLQWDTTEASIPFTVR
ncbi:MAG: DUF2911 domain-containing protein [Gemmatimonadetes bacterium]|nr:DUF2911 domain-containing protein [Gemmatimonadota bacterium]